MAWPDHPFWELARCSALIYRIRAMEMFAANVSLSPRRVLVIEDDPEMRDALVEVLKLEGYEVSSAADGAAGLQDARRQHPNVILLDLMMPVMSGWEFRAQQKRDPHLATVPVIVMSAFDNDLDVDESVPKPFTLEDMLDAVRRCAA